MPSLYIPRNINNPFNNLEQDEQILANLALAYKEMLKWEYEEYLGYDLDNLSTFQQMKGISSDKKGGIIYKNFMYSESYDDKDKEVDKDTKRIFAELSIHEAIKKYAIMSGDWPGIVCLLGKWYEHNIHTYQSDPPGVSIGSHPGRKFYPCPLFKTKNGTNGVGDDCTSFCFACIQLYWDIAVKNRDEKIFSELMNTTWPPNSIIWGDPKQAAAQNMEKYGFEIIQYSPDKLQPWDMVMGSKAVGATHGHGEIYVGQYKGKIVEFGWGSVHDGIGRSGMPAGTSYKEGEYSLIFRLKGLPKMSIQEVEKIIDKYK